MLIILYGKSGSGKDYLARKLIEDLDYDIFQSKRPTTRPKRKESEILYYHFYDEDDFKKAVLDKEVLFPKIFNVWHYGVFNSILAQSRDKDTVYILTADLETALEVQEYTKKYGGQTLLVRVSADEKTRKKRVLNREAKPSIEEIERRIASEKEDYIFEYTHSAKVDFNFKSSDNKVDFYFSLKKLIDFINKRRKENDSN